MTHPMLYEVNARHWLAKLSEQHGESLTLATVPEHELELLRDRGFTHLWLMGVWPTGPKSRAQAVQHPDLRKAYDEALPGWAADDILGSPYAVEDVQVSARLGGNAALTILRERLASLGLRLILDFVPNHLGLDHDWVQSRPELFVGQSEPFPDSFPVQIRVGQRFLAHGKDPYFPGWTDTVQLDYRRSETRQAMTQLLLSIAEKCDGVRCDMAMLLLSDVFEKTWRHVPCGEAIVPGEFWATAIAEVKERHPGFVFLAEAYWGLEGQLCELGFDYAYDKTLYDRVLHNHLNGVQPHLLGLGGANRQRAHFLENHDEPRVAGLVPLELQRVGMALCLALPGMRFFHEGQLEGARRFARVQLARRAEEPTDSQVLEMYETLFSTFKASAVGRGDGRILEPLRAWPENASAQFFAVVQWQMAGNENAFDLVVVNLAPHRAQCIVRVNADGIDKGAWNLRDSLGTEHWVRDGCEMAEHGLFLDLAPRSAQLFQCTR